MTVREGSRSCHVARRFTGALAIATALSGGVLTAGVAHDAAAAAAYAYAEPTHAQAADGASAADWVVQKIRNRNSWLCLVARGGRGSYVEQTECADFPDQDWEIRPYSTASSLFQFRNVHSGLCLLARGDTESWATVDICNKDYWDQLWSADGTAHVDYVTYHNFNSDLCLAARYDHPAIQTPCGNYRDQEWFPW
ncbi:RICIN domain-containing protein [Phytohabitans rumicis]|uniref:Ricin B lectin domain-containing protein n=1 Tax=Phytohabitans rumicis TaxID=1076125 RepID=A0A6V8KX90_9ACTN|nr:RICIN domain-containing protein [Phytohabitans rumicis]GFJ86919.1 hypothetical protein Prum_005610 [Phytohabitans rumicis]